MTVVLTDDNFAEKVLAADEPVLVDVWAPWCGPCQMMGPIINELAEDFSGRAVVAKLNVEECPRLAQKYAIRSIPTLLIFKGGQLVEQLVGLQSKELLTKKLQDLLAAES